MGVECMMVTRGCTSEKKKKSFVLCPDILRSRQLPMSPKPRAGPDGTYLYVWYFVLHMTFQKYFVYIISVNSDHVFLWIKSIQNNLRKSPDAFLELIFTHPELWPYYSCKHLMLFFTFMIQMHQIIQCERRPGSGVGSAIALRFGPLP